MSTLNSSLSAERLRQVLVYDQESGIFVRLIQKGPKHAGDIAGKATSDGYRAIAVDGTAYKAHRLAWLYVYGEWPKNHIDHIDRNRENNSIANLREATHMQNLHNASKSPRNTSGYKGVTWNKQAQKWRAQCRFNGKNYSLGYHSNPEDAHNAYVGFSAKHHGAFARAS